MIEFVAAIFGGAAANQLDEPLKSFDSGWDWAWSRRESLRT